MDSAKVESSKKVLSFQDIMSADDIRIEEIDVPEWGGVVRLRTLCAAESARFADDYAKDKRNSMVRLLVMSAVDEKGEPMFKDEHVEALRARSMKALIRVQDKVMEMNGLSTEKKAAAKND